MSEQSLEYICFTPAFLHGKINAHLFADGLYAVLFEAFLLLRPKKCGLHFSLPSHIFHITISSTKRTSMEDLRCHFGNMVPCSYKYCSTAIICSFQLICLEVNCHLTPESFLLLITSFGTACLGRLPACFDYQLLTTHCAVHPPSSVEICVPTIRCTLWAWIVRWRRLMEFCRSSLNCITLSLLKSKRDPIINDFERRGERKWNLNKKVLNHVFPTYMYTATPKTWKCSNKV